MARMTTTPTGFKCLDCLKPFSDDAQYYAHEATCPGDGFEDFEDFEGDGHSLEWKCPGCGHDNHNGDFWEVMPENNGYHGEASLYCLKCDREYTFKFEVEYSVELIAGWVKEVKPGAQ